MATGLEKTGLFLVVIIFTFCFMTNRALCEEQTNYGKNLEHLVERNVMQLVPNRKYLKEEGAEYFHIYCYPNVPKSFLQIWRSVQLELINVPNRFDVYPGVNETEAKYNYESKSTWDPSLIFFGSASTVDFPAFSPYCVGIHSREKYSFQLKVRTINYWKVLRTLLGTFLYLASPSLSKNQFFHYASGVSVGVLASILILLYILSRFIPQKSASYAVLVFGYSFILYFVKLFYHHFHEYASQYMDFVLAYCVIFAVISFGVCYRIGPVTNERTLNIIQWSMQALSLLLVFFSSEYREVSTAVILVLISIKIIPIQWIKWIKYIWYRCFPPKVKLLSELEYIEQGHIETRKALEELRKYCTSPDCKVWRVVRNLKDPIKFANFIESGNHYTDEEMLEYNSEDFEDFNLDDAYDEYTNRNTYVD